MLDIRSKEVLKFLCLACKEGTYQVIEIEEILASISPKYKMDKEGVLQNLRHLSSLEYISIKYQDDKVVCLCTLPFGRQVMESEEEHLKNNKKIRNIARGLYLAVLITALFGSFLGTLIYNLIF